MKNKPSDGSTNGHGSEKGLQETIPKCHTDVFLLSVKLKFTQKQDEKYDTFTIAIDRSNNDYNDNAE